MSTIDAAGLTWRELDEHYPDLVLREVHDGALIVTPAPRWPHQVVLGRLFRLAADWCDAHGGVTLMAPIDLDLGPRTLYQPDLVVYRAERRDEALAPDGMLHVPPDLVVEVSSPSTRARDLGVKRDRYAAFGVPEYWFVDLAARAVAVYRADGHGRFPDEPTIIGEGGTLEAARLPDLHVDVGALLRDVPTE